MRSVSLILTLFYSKLLISNNTVYKLFLNSVKNRILELIMATVVKFSQFIEKKRLRTIYRVATHTYKITK